MPFPCLDVANEFIRRAADRGMSLSAFRLIKLLYLVHGWCLAVHQRGEPFLLGEPFRAFRKGPNLPGLAKAYLDYTIIPVDNPLTGTPPLPEDARALVERILDIYGGWTDGQLIALTNGPDSPSKRVFDNPHVPDVILDRDIRISFRQMMISNKRAEREFNEGIDVTVLPLLSEIGDIIATHESEKAELEKRLQAEVDVWRKSHPLMAEMEKKDAILARMEEERNGISVWQSLVGIFPKENILAVTPAAVTVQQTHPRNGEMTFTHTWEDIAIMVKIANHHPCHEVLKYDGKYHYRVDDTIREVDLDAI